ncbi:HNH endonuclease [Deinococcus detaillensis]|uniref:HNH endonuclease n=1 Tax=Deinococcus detaillensis TaxID=2592048 RepID=A0A553US80_9DEIO|nr:HNH endonuclease [Deinococcus detaillensis]TSA83015.1 HNH endonuclease [Deinococcus detaillensis]
MSRNTDFNVEEYKNALKRLKSTDRLTKTRLKMLQFQYVSPKKTILDADLTNHMGWKGHGVNLHYGRLRAIIAAEIKDAESEIRSGRLPWTFLSSGEICEENYYWVMRPALAQALEELGLVEGSEVNTAGSELEPEFGELPPRRYPEGATRQVTVNAYERNRAARKACIAYHGTICSVCDSDLEEFYGSIAYGFIHVHHLKPLSEVGEGYNVDPETDLVPVCPNCHAMLHRTNPPLTIEQLRELIQEAHR